MEISIESSVVVNVRIKEINLCSVLSPWNFHENVGSGKASAEQTMLSGGI